MDVLGVASNVGEKLAELYGDYKTGRDVRLGSYKGANNTKQLGHYNKSGRRLGIYHGVMN